MQVKQTALMGIGIVMMMLFFFVQPVHAQEEQMYIVNTESLIMRVAPAQDATIAGTLDKGDHVTTFQEKFGWLRTFYQGKEVWIASQYLLPLEKTVNKPEQTTKKNVKQDKSIVTANSKTNQPKKDMKRKKAKKSSPKDHNKLKEMEPNQIKSASITLADPALPKDKRIRQHKIDTLLPLTNYHILLDAGHGGKDSGAIGISGILEKNLTIATANKVANQLRLKGASVTFTRVHDNYLSLQERVQLSNQPTINTFISLHYNSFRDPAAKGIGTFYYDRKGMKLADVVQKSIMKQVPAEDRGAKKADYYVLKNNQKPAILIELGFITNPEDAHIIQTETYQKNIAKAITDAMIDYVQ